MTTTSIKLLQLSDLHLTPKAGIRYRGVDVWHHLDAVLTHALTRHSDAQALLLTGDLVHEGDERSYRMLGERMAQTGLPWYWIPGNHDQPPLMTRTWGQPRDEFTCEGWQVLMLDSTDRPDGLGGGSLSACQLQRLRTYRGLDKPLLVVLHHNPMPVQSDWQDRISLGNRDLFWAELEQRLATTAILCGHVHQTWDLTVQGKRVMSCPSTAVQFRQRQSTPVIETEGEAALPGYRWLRLFDDGQLQTGIERVRLA